jgi:hypothetical protein
MNDKTLTRSIIEGSLVHCTELYERAEYNDDSSWSCADCPIKTIRPGECLHIMYDTQAEEPLSDIDNRILTGRLTLQDAVDAMCESLVDPMLLLIEEVEELDDRS